MAEESGKEIIADGGIKNPGDVAKAMAAGANYVMIGKMFAQCKESGGTKSIQNNQTVTQYFGSASALNKSDGTNIEGEAVYLPVKYTVRELYKTLEDGLKSAFSYSGARTPEEFRKNARFIRITNAGIISK